MSSKSALKIMAGTEHCTPVMPTMNGFPSGITGECYFTYLVQYTTTPSGCIQTLIYTYIGHYCIPPPGTGGTAALTVSGSGGSGGGPPGGGGGVGNPTNTPMLDQLLDAGSNLSPEQKALLEEYIRSLKQTCLGKALFNYMVNNQKKIKMVTNSTVTYQALYTPSTNTISFKSDMSSLQEGNFFEEVFHALQNYTVTGGTSTGIGLSAGANLEFESKVAQNIRTYVAGYATPFEINSNAYKNWVYSLTSDGEKVPTNYTSADNTAFQSHLATWHSTTGAPYNTLTRSTTYIPQTILTLANYSDCPK